MKRALASLLSAASFTALAVAATAPEGATSGVWMRLVPAGKFTARDGRQFDTGDRASLQAIVARTRQYHATTEMVVDYDHQSFFGTKEGVAGTAKAAGWVEELEVRDDGIWGRVAWTDAAAASIKAKEYRYLSPVIPYRKDDGRVLIVLSVALTNTPALDLEAAAASAVFNLQKGTEMEKILKALGLPTGSGEDVVLSAIHGLLTSSTALARAAGLTEDAAPAAVLSAVTAAVADRKRVATAAGLQAEASTDDVVSTVQAALRAGNPDPTKWVPIAALTDLRNQIKTLTDATTADKAEEAVAAAMKAGQLIPSMKEWAVALFKSDRKAFDDFVDAAPTLTAAQLGSRKRQDGPAALEEAQAEVCAALGVDQAAYRKTLEQEAR